MRAKTSLSRPARHCAELHVLYRRNFFAVHEKFRISRITTVVFERSMYLRGVMGFRGKFTGPSDGLAVLHFYLGRAIRICLACIASDPGRWIPPNLRIDEL